MNVINWDKRKESDGNYYMFGSVFGKEVKLVPKSLKEYKVLISGEELNESFKTREEAQSFVEELTELPANY